MDKSAHKFELKSDYKPSGDQPQAIDSIVDGINDGIRSQVLLGVTGSGKTYTMANIIERTQRPALILAHNKILAAQLCNEFREFFPNNRVEFFVSYYDYYQPEAYIARSDTYIEKDIKINDEIERLRHSATCSLYERNDTIIVASVSCIYGLGAPETYFNLTVSLRPGDTIDRDVLIRKLVGINYKRNDIDTQRSTFRVKGEIIEVFLSYSADCGVRIEFFGDTIESISEFDTVTGRTKNKLKHVGIMPATHYVAHGDVMKKALNQIQQDMIERVEWFTSHDKLIEAQRIKERVNYDLEMIREIGFCSGIENYSRYFDDRAPGTAPFTLLDYFKPNFLLFVDESHITIPQVRGMYKGDFARKSSLIDYGFRLPAAFDNRPLKFEEFNNKIGQTIYVSATPAQYELELSGNVAQQIIRPTGLLDPTIEVRPIKGQVEDLQREIDKVAKVNARVLVTTLTKKMAEGLTQYLAQQGCKVKYLHSEIDTIERIQIVQALRRGEFDVLVGINLLREGLDIPEVSLVAILDADKEGFLRSESSLIQTIGRAARNSNGRVIMYADNITGSMSRAIDTTSRRRELQHKFNLDNGVVPKTIYKKIKNTLEITEQVKPSVNIEDIESTIEQLVLQMNQASKELDFETAIKLREQISELKKFEKKYAKKSSK
ncbi:MAG: excinuclease ABC subunit UvrB [Clostridiales bacterium]|jgi:excinuclease ABC subunit B|nr:excinuclease ABC subunit UvrB [Clostridiales bacterium]